MCHTFHSIDNSDKLKCLKALIKAFTTVFFILYITQRKGVKESSEGPSEQSFGEDMHLNASVLDEDLESSDPPGNVSLREIEQDLNCDQLFGIDQAIVQSIERCGKPKRF